MNESALFCNYRFQNQTKSLQKALSKKLVIFTNSKCKFNNVWNTKNINHSLKLKIMLNTTAAFFMKVIVGVVKTMSVNP